MTITKITRCRECGSADLAWQTHNKNISDAAHGRLRTGDIRCQFVLGCGYCSETLAVYSADQVAAWLTEQSAPECNHCGDTGQIMVGRSGDANDGNAPIMEPCEDCDRNLPAELFAEPRPKEFVLTKCALCDQLHVDLTARDERIDRFTQVMQKVATLRGTLEQHGLREEVEALLWPDLYSRPEERGTPDAEPCSACGTPGYTGACDKCVPY